MPFLTCPVQKIFKEGLTITESPELEGTHKDRWVQLLARHRNTPKSDPMSESTVQTHLELQQARGHALGSPFQCLTTLFLLPSQNQPCHTSNSFLRSYCWSPVRRDQCLHLCSQDEGVQHTPCWQVPSSAC